MQAKEIYSKLRIYLGDTVKAKHSDWEVFNGINDALRLVAEENARVGGPLFRKRAEFTVDSETQQIELPEDFVKEIKAFGEEGEELLNVHNDEPFEGEFSVKGASLYVVAPPEPLTSTVTLWYFSYPPAVSSVDDEIDIPLSMAMPIAKIARSCVKGQDDAAVEKADFFYGTNPVGPQKG